MKAEHNAKLRFWQDRLKAAEIANSAAAAGFDEREALFRGSRETRPCTEGDKEKDTYHVRNLVAELIESEVDTNIPKPKVVAKYKEDRPLAEIIENMLRNELERLRFAEINDMLERTVPIQGGGKRTTRRGGSFGRRAGKGEAKGREGAVENSKAGRFR